MSFPKILPNCTLAGTLTLKQDAMVSNLRSPNSIGNTKFEGVDGSVKYTIGSPGDTTTDYAWTSAANTTEQQLDLGPIIPAKARIADVWFLCDVSAAGGITDLSVDIGNAAGGAQLVAAGSVETAAENIQAAVNSAGIVAISLIDSNVFVNGTPTGANWSTLINWKGTIYISYTDYAKLD